MIKLDKPFKPEYGVYIFGIAIAFLIFGQLLAGVVLQSAMHIFEKSEDIIGYDGETAIYRQEYILKYALSFVFQIFNFFVFFIFLVKTKSKPNLFFKANTDSLGGKECNQKAAKDGRFKRLIVCCGLGIVFAIVCLFCFMCFAEAGQKLLKGMGYKLNPDHIKGVLPADVLLVVLSVVFAPFCEEIVYRSGLLSGLNAFNHQSTYLKNIKCSLLCGLAFAFMHMNPEQTIYQFCLGFGASMLTLCSKSVIPAIVMHLVSNLMVSLSMVGVKGFTNAIDWYQNTFINGSSAKFAVFTVLFAVLGFAFFVLSPLLLKRVFNRKSLNFDINKQNAAVKLDTDLAQQGFLAKNKVFVIYLLVLGVCLFMWSTAFLGAM